MPNQIVEDLENYKLKSNIALDGLIAKYNGGVIPPDPEPCECVDGKDGKDGTNGQDGKDGTDGATGAQGKQGEQGEQGIQGEPGTGSGGGSSIHLYYAVSQTNGDIEEAILNIEELNKDGRYRILVIDKNVNITGTARTITIPKDIPVYVRRGITITTPSVSTPITGTVADNYIQLQINGIFTVDRDVQVFKGDGLIWFGYKSVQEIYADWFGIAYSNKGTEEQTNNVRSLQKAVNCIVLDKSNRATSKLRLNNGKIYLNSPVVAFACSLDEHPFLTGRRNAGRANATIIKIEGAEKIKHEVNYGNTTNIYYTAKWGAPFMLQGLRNSSISKIRFEGVNNFSNRDSEWLPKGFGGGANNTTLAKVVLRPDDFESGDIEKIAWIERDINWAIKRPYAAMITDPFRVDVANGGYNLKNVPESTIDNYYGTSKVSHQNSWSVLFEDLHIEKHVEGIINTLTGQQGDTFVYDNIQFQNQPIGLTTVQDQSRDCIVREVMAYSNVWAAFENTIHGNGVMPQVQGFHSAGGLKYIHYGSRNNGALYFNNINAELLYAFGGSNKDGATYEGSGITAQNSDARNLTNFPASINNSQVKISADNLYTTSEGECYLHRPPTIRGFNINSSLIAPYVSTDIAKRVWQPYEYCSFNGMVTGVKTDFRFPIDMGWFYKTPVSTLARERKVGSSYNLTSPLTIQNNGNLYGTTGKTLQLSETARRLVYDNVNYNIEETMYYRKLTNSTVKVFENRGFIEIDYVDAPFKYGDLIYLSRSNKITMGTIITNNGTTLRIANLSKKEMETFIGYMDDSNNVTGVLVYKIYFNKSIQPFLATVLTDKKTLSVDSYCVFANNTSVTAPVVKDTAIRMPDGNIYYIDDYTNNTITLDRDYNSALSYEWVEPLNPNFNTKIFLKRGASGNAFIQSSYYYKGEKYEYWTGENTKDVDRTYVICVDSGDFYEAREGQDKRAAKKANFIRYDINNNPIEYISGEKTIYPLTKIVTTEI